MTLEWKKVKESHPVEILKTDREIFLRDSKRPDIVMFLNLEDWEVFKKGIKEGEFD